MGLLSQEGGGTRAATGGGSTTGPNAPGAVGNARSASGGNVNSGSVSGGKSTGGSGIGAGSQGNSGTNSGIGGSKSGGTQGGKQNNSGSANAATGGNKSNTAGRNSDYGGYYSTREVSNGKDQSRLPGGGPTPGVTHMYPRDTLAQKNINSVNRAAMGNRLTGRRLTVERFRTPRNAPVDAQGRYDVGNYPPGSRPQPRSGTGGSNGGNFGGTGGVAGVPSTGSRSGGAQGGGTTNRGVGSNNKGRGYGIGPNAHGNEGGNRPPIRRRPLVAGAGSRGNNPFAGLANSRAGEGRGRDPSRPNRRSYERGRSGSEAYRAARQAYFPNRRRGA